MENKNISRNDILRNTLFHIQVKQCQYIDNFPEVVTSIFESSIERNGFKKYDVVKRRLYRIKTNFFKINNIKKNEFFEGLYTRLLTKTR